MISPASRSCHRSTGLSSDSGPGTAAEPLAAPGRATDAQSLDQCLTHLVTGQRRLVEMSLAERAELLDQCLIGVSSVAREWVDLACQAKGIPDGSPARAEEVLGGPVAVLRQLQLFRRTLLDMERTGRPQLPGCVQRPADGRIGIRVTPCPGLYDRVVFIGFQAVTWLQPDVTRDRLDDCLARSLRKSSADGPSLVLGAGNVSGIPVADVLSRVCADARSVLLKMNPVNDYLASVFERALRPLVENNLLRVVCGGPEVGAAAIEDARIADVHVTGSSETFDAIVWGPEGGARERRRAADQPVLSKPITSELGSVTPWIVVPGRYSRAQLRAQAASLVGSIVNNAGFNCVATRIVITGRRWAQREEFLHCVEELLTRVRQRVAYYPGAHERYERFAGCSVEQAKALLEGSATGGRPSASLTRTDGTTLFLAGSSGTEQTLPWTLLRNVDPRHELPLMQSEAFVCVAAEVPIDASSTDEFLQQATDFCNEKLWGTLACSITVPRSLPFRFREYGPLEQCLGRLRYGVVSLNQWAGLAFALMSPPWGGYPDVSAADIQSGCGWVHNSLMLSRIEKTVLKAPLVVWPRPVWDPVHSRPEAVAWSLEKLMHRPSLINLNRLAYNAMLGMLPGT